MLRESKKIPALDWNMVVGLPAKSGCILTNNSYYHVLVKNHLGSTMFLTNAAGDQIEAGFENFPYGKKIELTRSPEDITHTFTGKELDRFDV